MTVSKTGKERCRVVVDAMGGDYAPRNAVLGALEAHRQDPQTEVYICGPVHEIKDIISETGIDFPESRIIQASQTIGMDEMPSQAFREKKDSSIHNGITAVKDGHADAFVSAGNTGAVMTASTLLLGRLPGVGRPTIGSFMPNEKGISYVFDVGASVDSKPQHLFEYAILGSIFIREIYNIPSPTVGLLSVGEEASKGSEVVKTAHQLLKQTNLNFVGNIEGRDVLGGKVNVVICDGFVGNIILKFGESVLSLMKHLLIEYAEQSITNKLRAGLIKGTLKKILKKFDYQEYGGVPLLGVNGISIIGHGSSTPKAVKNMVLKAREMHEKNLLTKMQSAISSNSKAV